MYESVVCMRLPLSLIILSGVRDYLYTARYCLSVCQFKMVTDLTATHYVNVLLMICILVLLAVSFYEITNVPHTYLRLNK